MSKIDSNTANIIPVDILKDGDEFIPIIIDHNIYKHTAIVVADIIRTLTNKRYETKSQVNKIKKSITSILCYKNAGEDYYTAEPVDDDGNFSGDRSPSELKIGITMHGLCYYNKRFLEENTDALDVILSRMKIADKEYFGNLLLHEKYFKEYFMKGFKALLKKVAPELLKHTPELTEKKKFQIGKNRIIEDLQNENITSSHVVKIKHILSILEGFSR